MALLTKEQIAQADDVREIELTITEWGGEVRLRRLTVGQINEIRRKTAPADGESDPAAMGRLVVESSLVDPKMSYEELTGKSWVAYRQIEEAVLALNGLSGEASADARRLFPA